MLNNTMNYYSIAPMMGKTDSYFCLLMQYINKNITVYTEMMHSEAILRTNILDHYKRLNNLSNIIIQLAGNNPISMAKAAKKASTYGFSEININCGCPSKNVIAGEFGLSLLRNPKLVRNCIEAIKQETKAVVSVKTRIGIDYDENELLLDNFIREINISNTNKFIIHARNGILGKLSTKKNLSIPPLKYEKVFKLKKKFITNHIIINGGFLDTSGYKKYKKKIDGIMIGREAYKNPWIFSKNLTLEEKTEIVIKYIYEIKKIFNNKKINTKSLSHIQNIFNNYIGAKNWRKVVNITIHNNDLQYLLNYIKSKKINETVEK
jgi:tRNA-dihydrouridine synthase A